MYIIIGTIEFVYAKTFDYDNLYFNFKIYRNSLETVDLDKMQF